MIKAELTDGTNIFVVKIEHYVTLSMFTRALGIEFYDEISQEVEVIIRDSEVHFRSGLTQVYDSKLDELMDNNSFFKKLTKKRAEELLRFNLKMYGREGSIDSTMYEASYERGEALNRCYDMARQWVIEKFPHLKSKE
jgi:hypothetical protein